MEYYLMNKEQALAQLECRGIGANTGFSVTRLINPLPFWIDQYKMTDWVNSRHAPFNRKHMDVLFQHANIKDIRDYIERTKAISLNDTLWVKRAEDSTTWNSINPYTNPLNKVMANIAFGNVISINDIGSPSPELSTGGAFAKCWKRINGRIYMLKMGRNQWIGENDYEPFSEYFTKQIATRIGIQRHAKYTLGTHKGRPITYSELFTSEEVGLVSMREILGDFSLDFKNGLNEIKKLGAREEHLYRQMMILDAITFNDDRHFKNFGVFINNNTFEIIGMADIYDNNIALVPTLLIEGRTNQEIVTDLTDIRPKYYDSFFKLAEDFITDDIAKQITQILDTEFKLQQDSRVRINNDRLQFLNRFIKYNTKKILKDTGHIK